MHHEQKTRSVRLSLASFLLQSLYTCHPDHWGHCKHRRLGRLASLLLEALVTCSPSWRLRRCEIALQPVRTWFPGEPSKALSAGPCFSNLRSQIITSQRLNSESQHVKLRQAPIGFPTHSSHRRPAQTIQAPNVPDLHRPHRTNSYRSACAKIQGQGMLSYQALPGPAWSCLVAVAVRSFVRSNGTESDENLDRQLVQACTLSYSCSGLIVRYAHMWLVVLIPI